MKLKRKIALVLSAVMLCSSVSTTAFAETTSHIEDEIAPAYVYAFDVSNNLVISSGTAKCSSSCIGTSDVVKVSVEQTLQKFWGLWIWNDVSGAEWTKTVNYSTTTLSSTKSGLDSGTYRVKSVFELTDQNGETETITIYSDEVTI